MSKSILIMGESGTGKTTSLRTLPSERTYYIDADGKGLSWKGWRKQYNADNKNYKQLTDSEKILAAMMAVDKAVDDKGNPLYDYLVIDTINGSMLANEMDNIREKGYDKWVDLAEAGYKICRISNMLRDDLTVIITGHAETVTTDDGYRKTRLKSNGRKLEKIVLESLFTTVLLTDYVNGEYVFHTRLENSSCKTPMGAFEKDTISNDINLVITALEEY